MSNIVDLRPPKPTYGPLTNIGVVIQARMGSKRFPGKVLAILDGKPVLQHVIERCMAIRAPTKVIKPIKVIVAVPDKPESEPIGQLLEELGVEHFCGSEDNVLERYLGAANFFNLDVIMRITADCPLIDPNVCSEVLQLLIWRKLDYVSNCHEQRTFPKGLDCEVFTYDCLEYAYVMVKEDYKRYLNLEAAGKLANFKPSIKQCLYDMEHVTPYMIRHKDINKAIVKRLGANSSRQNWCIDYPEDIERIEKIIAKVKKPPKLSLTYVSNDNSKLIQAVELSVTNDQ